MMDIDNVLRSHGVGVVVISGGGAIKSIQSGMTELSYINNESTKIISINSVDPLKSIIIANSIGQSLNYLRTSMCMAEILNATQIKFTRKSLSGIARVYWQVIEFEDVKSLQKGTNASGQIAISSIQEPYFWQCILG
jgi:hypothetical protein